MEDSDLPPLPAASASLSRPALLTRKRTHDDYNDDIPMSAASSDPALFSGDEGATGAEDYVIKRKKKMYTGSWYSHRLKANRNDRKREFKRNYDSGIFMGSESSEHPSSDSLGSLEEELIQDQRNMELDLQTTPKVQVNGSRPFLRAASLTYRHAQSEPPPEHKAVTQIVQKSLDRGHESVDLSGLTLTSLPPEIVSLTTLTRQTNLVSGMLDHGEDIEAQLRLFLGANLFRRVPLEILDLTNLRLLSLWNNKLTSIPSGIRKLVNLETLNIGGNKLSYLPFEVIELAHFHKLQTITTEPNNWLPRPDFGAVQEITGWLSPETKLYIHRWHEPSTGLDSGSPNLIDSLRIVPSLTEVALRSLARLPSKDDLRGYMPFGTPAHVLAGLQTLHESYLDGGYQCSRCHRQIVQAAHQEIEWWALVVDRERARNNNTLMRLPEPLPFKRSFCRYGCCGIENWWCDEAGAKKEGETWSRQVRAIPEEDEDHFRELFNL